MSDFFDFFVRFLPDLLKGAGMTLLLTAEGLAAGFIIGLAATLARTYGSKFWKGVAVVYVEIFRGTPLLVQLFLLYYGLPGIGITMSRELAAFLALCAGWYRLTRTPERAVAFFRRLRGASQLDPKGLL